ncbi:ABC transporter substrate-binding protein [Roseomonas sp. NAR14]|uniref:ABC transporter substrate-binding protein n=1 Tax=Roseomonas acroporae TaxID=2937791 RepID=A0A9X1Y5Z1_9PROT|nr:ABC transporter substrate-binding protein [Roseomonas acroporae]MCK8784864.1 ABC transporter substrate-binding protein [Roseomonas acroporae]
MTVPTGQRLLPDASGAIRRRGVLAAGLAAAAIWPAGRALAQRSDNVVKIGVLDDMSGPYADQQGMGDVVAARMAIEDFGGRVGDSPIELVHGDLQNKPDVGMGIARRWYDQERVDAIFGLGSSAVAIAVQQLSREKGRISVTVGAGTTELTGKACSPLGVHWLYDNYALARATVTALTGEGKKRWFFITSDYAFGHSLEQNGAAMVRAQGGEMLGASRVPLGEADYSAHILRAAQSGAQAVGLALAGTDFINAVKQMSEFGLMRRGIQPAAMLCLITNIKAIGLPTAQGMVFTEAYYWDQNERTRAFSERFARLHGRPPTMMQASMWGAVTHYLKAVRDAGTDAAEPVMARMRATPIEDFMTTNGRIREDGRVIRDMYLMRAKRPQDSRGEWDLLEVVRTIPGDQAFRPLSEGDCPLVRRG